MLRVLLVIALLVSGHWAFSQVRQQVDKLNRLALRQMRKDPDSCRLFLKRSIKIAGSEAYFKGLANALNVKARLSQVEGNDLEAFRTYQKALVHYAKSDSVVSNNQAIVLRNMAAILLEKYQYKDAISFYDSSEYRLRQYISERPERSRKTNKFKSLNDIMYYRALAQKRSGKLLDANKTLNLLWKEAKQQNNGSDHARVLIQLGLVK